jgi:hypothetical protein
MCIRKPKIRSRSENSIVNVLKIREKATSEEPEKENQLNKLLEETPKNEMRSIKKIKIKEI